MDRGYANVLFVFFYYLVTFLNFKNYDNTVYFFDVGMGDSIGILHDNKRVLIDTGRDYQSLYQYAKHVFTPVCRIDAVFLTHLDNDHIGGLGRLASLCAIDVVYIGGASFKEAVNSNKIMKITEMRNVSRIELVSAGDRLVQGSLNYQILAPSIAGNEKNENARSIVILLSYKDTGFFLTGDSEIPQIKKAREVNYQTLSGIKTLVYKVPHHGSKNNLDEAFAAILNPRYCVISVGDNSYGHPNTEVLDNLTKYSCKIMRTDLLGNIKFEL